MQYIALAAKKQKRPPVKIMSNWKRRADTILGCVNWKHDALRDLIAEGLQKAYADGRKASDRSR